jgi:hypothetical protein
MAHESHMSKYCCYYYYIAAAVVAMTFLVVVVVEGDFAQISIETSVLC